MEHTRSTGAVKLRASCNACNESKVRCSQTKPICDRCARTGLPCVFGLSRRSHKDAPPIRSSARASAAHTAGPSRALHDLDAFAQCPDARAPALGTSSDILPGLRDDQDGWDIAALLPGSLPDAAAFLAAGSGGGLGHLLNAAFLEGGAWDVSDESLSPAPQPPHPPLPSPTLLEPQPPPSWGRQIPPHQQRVRHSTRELSTGPGLHLDELSCSCSARVIPELARQSRASSHCAGRPLSFDVELSRLKLAITACEASMACQAHASDTTVTMMLGLHVGDIVDGFKALLSASQTRHASTPPSSSSADGQSSTLQAQTMASSPTSSPSTHHDAGLLQEAGGESARARRDSSAVCEPRLSWGVLQLEDDDEVDLRHRLCQLYFRRLGGLLRHFDQSIRQFRAAQGTAESATATFLMACDYVRMWLDQKVEAVKELLSDVNREAAL